MPKLVHENRTTYFHVVVSIISYYYTEGPGPIAFLATDLPDRLLEELFNIFTATD